MFALLFALATTILAASRQYGLTDLPPDAQSVLVGFMGATSTLNLAMTGPQFSGLAQLAHQQFRNTETELCDLFASKNGYEGFTARVKELAQGPEDPRWPYVLTCKIPENNVIAFIEELYRQKNARGKDGKLAERIQRMIFIGGDQILRALPDLNLESVLYFYERRKSEYRVDKYHQVGSMQELMMQHKHLTGYGYHNKGRLYFQISFLPDALYYQGYRWLLENAASDISKVLTVVTNSPRYAMTAKLRHLGFNFKATLKFCEGFQANQQKSDVLMYNYSAFVISLGILKVPLEKMDLVCHLLHYDGAIEDLFGRERSYRYIIPGNFRADLEDILSEFIQHPDYQLKYEARISVALEELAQLSK